MPPGAAPRNMVHGLTWRYLPASPVPQTGRGQSVVAIANAIAHRVFGGDLPGELDILALTAIVITSNLYDVLPESNFGLDAFAVSSLQSCQDIERRRSAWHSF